MRYSHTFLVQAAHFNGQKSYDLLQSMREGSNLTVQAMKELLRDVHGHNFQIEVTVESEVFDPEQAFVLDDIEMQKIVMEWNNTNLSVHPDFMDAQNEGETKGIRATTENMAALLSNKIANLLEEGSVEVIVHETDEIYASCIADV